MLRIVFWPLLLLAFTTAADAQDYVTAATSTNSFTIGSTNTFVQALPSKSRKGCTIQYNGGNTGFVFFGTTTSATTPAAIQLKAQQAVYCEWAGIVLTDAVQITGTAGDQFIVYQQ